MEKKIPEPWLLKLLDSWGKLPAGIMSGHLREIGHFDQCLEYEHNFNSTSLQNLRGQYCTGVIPLDVITNSLNLSIEIPPGPFPTMMGFQLGICVPDTCTPQKINEVWIRLLRLIGGEILSNETLIHSCEINNKSIEFNAADYIGFIIFGLVAFFTLASTLYDYLIIKQGGRGNDLLIAFSVITNGEKLFKISTKKSPNVIECLNGLRCISIVWIVLGHSYATFSTISILNGQYAIEWFKTFFSVFIQFGTVSVDTFLFLSGLLVIWSAFREMEKNGGRLNVIMMYIHRYLRLTPALAAAVLFSVSFVKYIGDGPFWQQNIAGPIVSACEDKWWATLIYVQNYVMDGPIGQTICIPQSWYLAVDTQLFLLSPLVLLPLWKWGRKMILPIIILALLSNACVFTIFMKWDFSTIKSSALLFTMERMKMTYVPTHARYAPWLIGILIGYFLFETKNKKTKLPKVVVFCGWFVSIAIILAVIIGPYNRVREGGGNPTKIESSFYEAFSRTSWSIALAWIVFACHKGYGGMINSFLSWTIWEPFSRLTYSIYIVHFPIQYLVNANTKHDKYFSNFDVMYKFWGDFGFTLCIATLLTLSFESPIIGIEKVLFKRGSEVKDKKYNTKEDPNTKISEDALNSDTKYEKLKLHLNNQIFNESLGFKFYDISTKNININKLNSTNSKNDELCESELTAIRNGILTGQLWAYKVIDSWGKIPTGILVGHLTDVGNFEECIGISEMINQETEQLLEGKYCFAELSLADLIGGWKPIVVPKFEPRIGWGEELNAIKNLKIAVCVPKSCRTTLADDALRNLLQQVGITLDKEKPIIQSSTCKTKLVPSYRTVDIVAISFFSFIGFLMLISSAYDYTTSSYGKKPIKILTAFSIVTNGRKLFQIQDTSKRNPNVIECLNGIRSLSIIWVVFGHQYFVSNFVTSINAIYILEWARSPFALLMLNGVLSVDSFFLLSGCLVSWIGLKTLNKTNGKLNVFKMYLHRYLRLTPLLAAMVLFTASLQRYLGNGPFWNFDQVEQYCQENWWSTLLYVANYVHGDKLCFGHSWYLCVDTQLYILSPLILWPLWKWGKIAFLPIIICIQASMGYVFAEWMSRDYHYLFLEFNDNDLTKQKYIYYATHARVSAYLVGVLLGYYLYQYRNKKMKLSKFKIMTGWLCCLSLFAVILFGPYHRSSKQPESGMTTIEGAIYEPFSRFAWAIALSWVIFACHHGFGGFINKILTFGIWQPIARLSYGIYLSHLTVQMVWYGNYKVEQNFSDMETIFMFWACFGITLCITVIIVLAFESPIIIIENWVFGNGNLERKNVILEPTTSKNINDPKESKIETESEVSHL
ncbi:uncharacterized protein LOC129605190 [Condylostylus longicornis]|uniref:uncharacterized protein LOC129605190 n=1 Tax=Condylostylus longicornis TaxID=2530218 RepID=UPI00244DDFEC|nr:uncharacterized protein LOC129605190 [Condylostylus longicornis]